MSRGLAFADRTAVLFLGVGVGAAIGYAFGSHGAPAPVPAVLAPQASIAPPAASSPPPPPGSAPPAVAAATTVAPPTAATPASPVAIAPVETAGGCAPPVQPRLADTVAQGRPITVGVFGDSFGDGVWSALYRLLPARDRFRVLKFSQQSTGFTRYASLNLEEHARAQLAAQGPIDIAVISFGANDTQGVYTGGGHAAALMSPGWQRVIGERVDRFVQLMRSRGATVYWVGLPKMRETAFDQEIAAMNAFYTARMRALCVPFIDTKPFSVDAAGQYAPYLPDPVSHETRLMRANDGVHMSMNGYVVITRGLAGRIRADVAAARTAAGSRGAVTIASAPPAPEPSIALLPARPAPVQPDRPKPRPPLELKFLEAKAGDTKPAEPKSASAGERPPKSKRVEPVTPDLPDNVVAPPIVLGNDNR